GRHLEKILEERDAPARRRGRPPRPGREVLQVRIPGEGHEHVGGDEQRGRDEDRRELGQSSFSTPWSLHISRNAIAEPRPGIATSSAISIRGRRTKARSCIRGCGIFNPGTSRAALPNKSKSRSSVRGALAKLRRLPCAASMACSAASSRSAGRPVSTCATAFTKLGCSP